MLFIKGVVKWRMVFKFSCISVEKITGLIDRLKFSEPALRREVFDHGKLVSAKKGDVLIKEGQYLDFLPIVISGSIRVYQQKEDREILLYYVRAEQTCVMSLSSAYFNNTSTAYGIAMEPTDILVIPTRFISEWQLKYPSWNEYVIRTFRSRYDELLNSFGSVAFEPVEQRLKNYLSNRVKSDASNKIYMSHQDLADELGTTRVVVSRILKQLEQRKSLKLYRGHIELIDSKKIESSLSNVRALISGAV